MKIVIAPDSFKGSISSMDAALSIERGILHAYPQAETVLVPVADGGEGTMENLVAATGGHKTKVHVIDPLKKPFEAEFGVLGDQQTCIIEIAAASGLNLVSIGERNPLKATTYGTGQLIKAALDEGYRNFILALGGSATNDGGAGMLQALGVELKNSAGKELDVGGGELGQLQQLSTENFDPRIEESQFTIASDVENPFVGPTGATYVFGPQKGATEAMVKVLDANLLHFANKIEEKMGVRLHDSPGAGAAGGIGGAFQAFFPSTLRRGVDVVVEYARLEEQLENADLVITGEGQVDFQTAYGKTPMGVAQSAKAKNIPTIILAGSYEGKIDSLYQYGVIGVYSVMNKPMTLDQAMKDASLLLEKTAEQVCRTYFFNRAGDSL
ncbi:glycerate kinase [Peribacillus psychrosaccharolyticus]|uniref:Glycerate kinase n=1 Tax=Peribacillus psychrosaccharolyticus TaxID=1407 RepID=A0A974NIS5_PERPY|nr:glycerate kinase [Peribacillus psychrosaccharolyticus]MEC2057640.1 glycerate kinase [Peribacillus psychrosaccharolyticus]MED3744785.1 glycerate kinase [Peribacillus psychrosaccharolyticus]QQS98579.1 glycerate kinase [Peribacillus psychrosaccharolyticus]